MKDHSDIIKSYLQKEFSMPFSVSRKAFNGEDHYFFSPTNEGKEFFEVEIYLANGIRVVIEVKPQLHAAAMLSDMQNAPQAKRDLFKSYVQALERKGARIACSVNGRPMDLSAQVSDGENWRNFGIRITKSPVIETDDDLIENVLCEWGIMATCMILSLLTVIEINPVLEGKTEGEQFQATVNKYERNPINRQLCLAIKGYRCNICGFDFEKVYGEIGRGFIHVHHITPVSKMGPGYVVNPAVDLIPVCPNCHAMLHRKDPPYTPEEILEAIMDENDLG